VTLNEALDKARAAAMPEIPPPITITEGGERFCPSMCVKNPPAANPFGGWSIDPDPVCEAGGGGGVRRP